MPGVVGGEASLRPATSYHRGSGVSEGESSTDTVGVPRATRLDTHETLPVESRVRTPTHIGPSPMSLKRRESGSPALPFTFFTASVYGSPWPVHATTSTVARSNSGLIPEHAPRESASSAGSVNRATWNVITSRTANAKVVAWTGHG